MKDYKELFKYAEEKEPSQNLVQKILFAIDEKQRRSLRFRVILSGSLALIALIAFIPAWREFQTEISQSGFWQFVSLLFSDSHFVVAYWNDLLFSLLESLPIVSTMAVLGVFFIFLSSLSSLVKNIGGAFIHRFQGVR